MHLVQYIVALGSDGGAITGESVCIMLLYFVHYAFIDVNGMMTMFAIDIWGDRHASAVILLFGVHYVHYVLSDRLLTVDCRAARCFRSFIGPAVF